MQVMPRLRPKLISLPLILIITAAVVPVAPTPLYSGEVLVPAEWRDAHPGPHEISLTVAVDEEWRRTFGPDAEDRARQVVEISAKHLRPAGINLRFGALETWTSDDDGVSLSGLLDALELFSSPGDFDMVVGLTAGRYAGKVDGVARPRRPYIVVKRHPRQPERDAYVLTHEIGHVLGLSHHVCPDGRCFMADHKFDLREHWCSGHLDILTANAGYWDYIRDGEPQA